MPTQKIKLYKQEGSFGLYQTSFPFYATDGLIRRYLPKTYGEAWGFVKNGFGQVYLQEKKMDEVVRVFLKLAKGAFPKGWEKHWNTLEKKIVRAAFRVSQAELEDYSFSELYRLYHEMEDLHEDMWAISIFIDTFDTGGDQREIERVSKRHSFSLEEVQTLLIPTKSSYITNWDNILYQYKAKKVSFSELKRQFFWIRTDYLHFGEMTEDFVREKAKKAHPVYSESPIRKQKRILKKYKLAKNPFYTLQTLSLWRDERKRLNFTGLYGLERILREVFERKGVPPKLINGFLPQEVKGIFFGRSIDSRKLVHRVEEGFFVHFKSGTVFKYKEGMDGEKAIKKFDNLLIGDPMADLEGMVACKGYARGVARVVLSAYDKEAKKMRKGDILVTSMTRPEFVSLMKMASAIVTNEGGISCHAAIVARELKKPCIIGTKIATQVLKDGDYVEVDAEKGIVRKIK
ncbi:MAG: Phosphoenolpyruvate synthase/pyruvate phosphate dikinase [Parcubacteria group bacterium GW2011_GWC2_45_7]|nr:MAG: Phosphoenolpyruvate synthase/pyruvate phosphate dikinase [Parcubacteria group bacterium GW2011_GWC2_45_7]